MYFDSHNKNECCGCTACLNACPTDAISMQEDEEGFLYPSIKEEVCINCNLCRKVCIWENARYNNELEPLTLAAVINNKDERQRSTSGGLFYAIAEWIIDQGGVVFGAAFDNELQLIHVGADNLKDLQKLRGSKYLQSNIGEIFKNVKKNLENDRWCYFTGTGCQVAGLKSYLRKDYPKLITSDIVCHGVPSQKLFNEHISYMEKKYGDKVINYHFRDYKHWGGCEICSFVNHHTIINQSYELSPYLYSFMYGFTFRYSCYECKFAKLPRQGDITLADFWGVEQFFPKFDTSNGCSLLLLNSKKGTEMWKIIERRCTYNFSNVKDAAMHNGNLVYPSSKPEIRSIIYKLIKEQGYETVAKKHFRSPYYTKNYIYNIILKISILHPLITMYRKLKKLIRRRAAILA